MTEDHGRVDEVAANLAAVRDRLGRACVAAGRPVEEVTLLPVTKFFPASDVEILYTLGAREFGESREQEAAAKVASFGASTAGGDREPVRWHMIGQIQRNKAKSVAKWAYAVHSIDSIRLADALSRASTAALDDGIRAEPLRSLIQVSLDGDPSRGGVPLGELDELADRIAAADGLTFAGLMAVPPLGSDPDEQFDALLEAHSALRRDHPGADMLSAGMSGDMEAAVRHGSTCVRVGTALLGSRQVTSR